MLVAAWLMSPTTWVAKPRVNGRRVKQRSWISFSQQWIAASQERPCDLFPRSGTRTAIVAGQLSRQRGKNPNHRELEESSVRHCIHAMAPGVVDLSLQAMAEPLHRGQLKTIVVTVRSGGELADRA